MKAANPSSANRGGARQDCAALRRPVGGSFGLCERDDVSCGGRTVRRSAISSNRLFLECAMPTLLWMECGACSGESMAILGAGGQGIGGDNLADFLESSQLQLLWHPSLSLESPNEVDGLIRASWPEKRS